MSHEDNSYESFAEATGIDPQVARMARLMMPHATRRQVGIFSSKGRFVHYTSANTAVSILRSKEIWLRKVACMNDLSEVQYGLALIHQACSPERFQTRLRDALNKVGDDIVEKFEKLWIGWERHLFSDSYVFCLSEHDDTEDVLGRLSMWRAYGRSCGIALVVNPLFATTSADFGAVTSPVAYFNEAEFLAAFEELVFNLENNAGFFQTVQAEKFIGMLFNVFRFAALATKHPAFKESASGELSTHLRWTQQSILKKMLP